MNPIYWLEIAKSAKYAKHLSNHFILKVQNKYMVFTTKPINGIKSHLISKSGNIEGKLDPQYLIEKIHTIDPVTHYLKLAEKGSIFYAKHQELIQPMIEKLSQ